MTRPALKNLYHFWKRPRILLVLAVLAAVVLLGGPHLLAWHHLSAGRTAVTEYRTADARDHLRRCLAVWPSCAEAHLLAARAARRADDFAAAESHLDECRRLAGEESSEGISLEWALLRAASGDLPQVEEPLRGRLEKERHLAPLILEALADGYRRMSRIHEALICLEDWLRLQPDNPQALLVRGKTHHHVGAVNRAAEDYRRVVEIDPGHDDARRRLLRCLAQFGRTQEALDNAELLLRRHKDDSELLVIAARCRYDLGQKAEADRLLRGVLAAEPGHGPALKLLGRLEVLEGRDAEAERWLREAVRVLPYDYETLFALSQCLRRLGKSEESKATGDKSAKLKESFERLSEIRRREMSQRPFDPTLHAETGRLLIALGEQETGRRWLHSALQLDERNAAAHVALADYYQVQGDRPRAEFHRARAGAAEGRGPNNK